MGRRPSRQLRQSRPLRPTTIVDAQEWNGADWYVRRTTGSGATKSYRCPGCQQLLPPATPHVVVWPADDAGDGLGARRHWHTPCWDARDRRRPR